jgi:hypothetical protein
MDAVRIAVDPARRGLEGKPGLARPARPDGRQQSASGVLQQASIASSSEPGRRTTFAAAGGSARPPRSSSAGGTRMGGRRSRAPLLITCTVPPVSVPRRRAVPGGGTGEPAVSRGVVVRVTAGHVAIGLRGERTRWRGQRERRGTYGRLGGACPRGSRQNSPATPRRDRGILGGLADSDGPRRRVS